MKINQCLYYHPTMVVIIDDNESFTDSLLAVLTDDQNIYKTFNTPISALKYLKEYDENLLLTNILFLDEDNENKINLRPEEIYNVMLNNQRFAKISTVIIDYEMHGTTGLEILEQIQDKKFAKILLTGVADEKIAIEAFNRGLINKYIKKHDPNFTNIIQQTINKNNYLSFKIDNLQDLNFFEIINSVTYNEFFRSLIIKYNIIEYYICDIYGSMVMIDEKDKIWLLCFREESKVKELYTYAKLENYPEDQLEALKSYKMQICYIEGITTRSEDVNDSIFDAHIIKINNSIYIYSVADNISSELSNKVISFNKYQNTN